MQQLQEYQKRRKASTEARQGTSLKDAFLKLPNEGEIKVRFLPSKEDNTLFFKEFGEHWLDKQPFICPKVTNGDKCPICESVRELYNSENKDDKILAGKLRAKKQHYANVIVKGKEDEGPKIFKYGIKLSDIIIGYCLDPDYYNIADAEKGYDFRIIRERNEADMPQYDKSKPVKNSSSVPNKDLSVWLEKAIDINQLVNGFTKTYEEIQEAFSGIVTNKTVDKESPVSSEEFNDDEFIKKINNAIK